MVRIKRKNQSHKKIKGGCGCSDKSNISQFTGGKKNISKKVKNTRKQWGGNFSTSGISAIPFPANFETDPTAPANITDSRLIVGGKKRRSIRKKINKRKYKGGDLLLGYSGSNNIAMGAGTTSGAFTGLNLLSGSKITDAAPYSQPVSKPYNITNPYYV